MITNPTEQVAFIVAHDAYLRGARNIHALMEKTLSTKSHWYTTSKNLAGNELEWLDVTKVADQSQLRTVKYIFAGLGGRDLNQLIKTLKIKLHNTSPIIIGYFPGILHLRIFESLTTRLLCDQVLLNCERDYKLYQQIARATTRNENGILFGAPWIRPALASNPTKEISFLFIEQSIVPESLKDRTNLVKNLIKLAKQQPDWKCVVALRARQGEASSHSTEHCLEKIYNRLKPDLENLHFVVEDIDMLIARSHHVATISSSAALTSLAWGKLTLFINDMGVKEAFGNNLFKDSGHMTSLQNIPCHNSQVTDWHRLFVKAANWHSENKLQLTIFSKKVEAGIPRIGILNPKLILLIVVFFLKHLKNPMPETNGLFQSVRNINKRIYKTVR